MTVIAAINFIEPGSLEEACAIVRADDSCIALTLTRKADGDLEVMMARSDALMLIDALRRAVG